MTRKQRTSPSGSRPKPGRSASTTDVPEDGKVGIFWWHRGRLLVAAVALENGDETEWVIDSPVNHVHHWPKFQRLHPELRQLEYEEVPRGRVLFTKETKMFCVYMDLRLHQARIKTALRRTFGLTGRRVRFATDPHYTTDKAQLDRLFDEKTPLEL